MSMLKSKMDTGREVFPKAIWVCEHELHATSRCSECFDETKTYETMSLKEALEKIKIKKGLKEMKKITKTFYVSEICTRK